MQSLIRIMILMSLASSGAFAQAGLLFEPYGGYSVGSTSKKYSAAYPVGSLAGTNESASVNGFAYGGRVGFLLQHFVIVAAEYQAINAKEKADTATTQTNWTQHTMFATLGFQAPRGFRLMGSYGFDAQADEATTPDPTHYKGTALKFAIGWHLPTTMALNLEYTIYKYTDTTTNSVNAKIADGYEKYDYSTVMATISFPFDFGGGMGHRSSGGGSGGGAQ
ncbi:MAG: outer membrane beta-barrel protein [Bdellovibrionales bacterium]